MKKSLVRIASTLFPNMMVNKAYEQFANPQVRKLREHELEVLDTAQKSIFPFQGFDIQLYEWRQEKPKDLVLLIHGWEGQAGNFSDLIERFVAANYDVVAFDAPSHGFSSKGETSLFAFSELVAVLIRKFGAKKLVSHSFGGVATTYSLSANLDIEIDKYALLTTPDKFSERIEFIQESVGITEKVKNRLVKRIEDETQKDVNLLNVSEFVKVINVKSAMIIHDKNDGVLPIERSRNVHNNWGSVSQFVEVEGTGHFRILRTDYVLDKVLDYLEG